MEITSVRVKLRQQANFWGYADIIINNCLTIHGLKILDSAKGVFVDLPNRKKPDGTFRA